MRQRRTALKHVLSWERVQGSLGEPIPQQLQRQGPKPDGAHTAQRSDFGSV